MKTKIVVIAEKNGKKLGYALTVSNMKFFRNWLKIKDFDIVYSRIIKNERDEVIG